MTLQQASRLLLFQLYHLYDNREAANIVDLVMENLTEWKRVDRILNKELVLSPEKEKLFERYLAELSTNKPVQYVLHEAWFAGMRLYVDEHVLIPRPETEELVDWVAKENTENNLKGEGVRILDVGTGSGCIALGLKKKLPLAEISACDISEQALAIAQQNAQANEKLVNFFLCDFLNREAHHLLPMVNTIVSNPPYIPLQDKPSMQSNVLQYEPHLALFVDDDDVLVFYKAIADFAKTHLAATGAVYVEIHEQMRNRVESLFAENGFINIECRTDLQGKERMIRASRK